MARMLTNYYGQRANQMTCSKREIEKSEIAFCLGKKPHHKLHLVFVYQRMCRTGHVNSEASKTISKETYTLLKEVMDETNDLFLLKNCSVSLCKLSTQEQNTTDILEKLVDKLETSNNGYVHGAIGYYYLFIIKRTTKKPKAT